MLAGEHWVHKPGSQETVGWYSGWQFSSMTHLICLHIYEHDVKGKSDRFPENGFPDRRKINTGMESLYTGNVDCFPIRSLA